MKTRTRFHAGFTLIEVLIGILVFALGMMALAQLQGNLSKSSAEANARTVAVNIAEETIERLRSFSQVTASTTVDAFNNIVPGVRTVERGGISYTLTQAVTNYYYNRNTGAFQTTKPDSRIVNADLKRVQLTVAWGTGNAAQSFQIDESNASSSLGTGSVTLVDLISSFTTGSGAKVVLNNYGDGLYSPPVDYNPGQNPDIVSIELGQNKFKESTTPLPDVIRADELVETRFDVVTYSQSDSGATFLRREEFRAVSCECTLRIPADTEGGRRPTVWSGSEYSEGEFVAKPFGEEASNQQSQFCDLCCRDHHDGGTGANDVASDPGRSRYNPFGQSISYYDGTYPALQGDHKHFSRDRLGNLVLATTDGSAYVEACRLVRKDGFWRVAQDLRQEGLNAFPGNYLDDHAEVDEYSSYVTGAVSAYEFDTDPSNSRTPTNPYELSPPTFTKPQNMPISVVFPASTYGNATQMQSGGTVAQQLRSRGIYLDYMNDELRAKINCLDLDGSGESCGVPGVTTALEIIPFYDVQLTWLARWNETPNNNPIDVSNEAIADNNAHSRGVATLEAGFGYSTVNSAIHSRNLGLTGTDPIDPWYGVQVRNYDLYALAVDYNTPPPLSTITVSGTITSSVPGVKAADVEIQATDAQCDRTLTGFECVIEATAQNPRLTVSNYFRTNRVLLGCSRTLTINGTQHSGTEPAQNWTRFNLPKTSSTTQANIVIMQDVCL